MPYSQKLMVNLVFFERFMKYTIVILILYCIGFHVLYVNNIFDKSQIKINKIIRTNISYT